MIEYLIVDCSNASMEEKRKVTEILGRTGLLIEKSHNVIWTTNHIEHALPAIDIIKSYFGRAEDGFYLTDAHYLLEQCSQSEHSREEKGDEVWWIQ